jgi:tripartite ATP-independent transporter DctM subunit
MSSVQIAGLMFASLLGLIALRVPIGAAMFVSGAAGYWMLTSETALLNYLKRLLWARFAVYDLSVIPLFLLMGQFATAAGFSRTLFRAANTLMGHRSGGIAQAAIVACAAFGAICGSSVATTATMSQVALPEMRRLEYSDRLSTGTLAVGGTFGIIIPPSVILIIYALLAEQSIIKLFAAAMLPGLVAAIGYIITISIYVRLRPGHASVEPRANAAERVQAIQSAWPIAAIFIIMFVGIYGGYFTATEGAAVGTAATLLLGFAWRQLSLMQAIRSILPAAQASGMIFMVLLGAEMLNTALAVSRLPANFADWIATLEVVPIIVVICFLLVFIVLTSVLDELAMMLLFLPIVLPVIVDLELYGLTVEHKSIWFGILMLAVVQLGLVLPPIGLNVYVVSNIARTVPLVEIYRGIAPFLISDFLRVMALLFFPQFALAALWLVR